MEESVLEEPLQKGAGGGQSPVGPGSVVLWDS